MKTYKTMTRAELIADYNATISEAMSLSDRVQDVPTLNREAKRLHRRATMLGNHILALAIDRALCQFEASRGQG